MDTALATISRRPRMTRGTLPLWLVLLLVIAIGVNIRAIFGVTPPLVPMISEELGLSATTASLLTALPVLAMAVGAPLGHTLTTRMGTERSLVVLLVGLGLAELTRLVIDTAVPLVLSAAVIGAVLGAVSTLTPAFISAHLPRMRGLGTGIYSTSMALGVGLAAGTAMPITDFFGSWRISLSLWGATALVLALLLAAVRTKGGSDDVASPKPVSATATTGMKLPLRERRAWFVSAVYCVPMFLGFGVIAWLPSLFIEVGIPATTAATYLVLFQGVQVFSILTLTPLTDRIRERRGVFATVMITATLGLLALTLEPNAWALPGALLAGFGIGGASSLGLVKLQDEAVSPADATRLSAMAMVFSFTAGAVSPFAMGALKDLSGSLVPGFGLCLGVSALSMVLLIRMNPAPGPPEH